MTTLDHNHVRSRLARGLQRPTAGQWTARAGAALSVIALGGAALAATPAQNARTNNGMQLFADPAGVFGTLSVNGAIDTTGAFFQSLGTNGRSCSSCHVASQAMSISPPSVRARFIQSRGLDPLFAPVDGANCPTARRGNASDHSLLLRTGLIRVGLPILATAEYTISVVHDPYGCAIMPDPQGGQPIVSVYRRPLPTTNLSFLSAVMFDGRETVVPLNNTATFAQNLVADLSHQAADATTGHAQAKQPPTDSQLADIVNFELGLYTAQQRDSAAGALTAAGAQGGPAYLAAQAYFPGINDALGASPDGAPFNPVAMTAFAPWAALSSTSGVNEQTRDARLAIAAGEQLFNTAPVIITNVRGLNDNAALGKPGSLAGHCTTCHDTPNVGDHSLPLPLDIGTAHSVLPSVEVDSQVAAGLAELSMPDLPVYLVSGCPNPFNAGQPESFYTSDPGKALLTGLCSDFNRLKGPILRGLAARAPYFHNGAAANLTQLVNFYDQRFQMGLTDAQKSDLVAFLNAL